MAKPQTRIAVHLKRSIKAVNGLFSAELCKSVLTLDCFQWKRGCRKDSLEPNSQPRIRSNVPKNLSIVGAVCWNGGSTYFYRRLSLILSLSLLYSSAAVSDWTSNSSLSLWASLFLQGCTLKSLALIYVKFLVYQLYLQKQRGFTKSF